MSTFALSPPDGITVLSFFITARLASQDTRAAFTDVLLEQLAELTGQPIPALLTESTCESHLLNMLADAAKICGAGGQTLVLLVDGLDEDRGITAGPQAHSIAALLPVRPPAGLRVIVASRSNVPLPDDVPADHPLRDPGVERPLPQSPSAQVVRQDAERELHRLLEGSAAERELLGLLVAAVGGLTATDLSELIASDDVTEFGVRRVLRSVAGRSFAAYAGQWHPGAEVFALAHEELQGAAAQLLGERELARYRGRLHEWASGYASGGWPARTPEYLLLGYFRMLQETGEVPRLVACATDLRRHDRMLDVSGGDTHALAEVRAAFDAIAAQDLPDLTAVLNLARHRDHLTRRNQQMPEDLPALWARLGNPSRGVAIAQSLVGGAAKATAFAGIAVALLRMENAGEALRRAGVGG